MTSPSVRSTSRSTPWVLGCCGPMLRSISSVRTSNSTIVGSAVETFFGSVAVAIGNLVQSRHTGDVGVIQDQFVDGQNGNSVLSRSCHNDSISRIAVKRRWQPSRVDGDL